MARFVFVILGLFAFAAPVAAQRDPAPRDPGMRNMPLDINPLIPRVPTPPNVRRNDGQPADNQAKKADAPRAPLTLDQMYESLAKAKTRQEASVLIKQIERRWARSGSDTADLLLSRANTATNAKDHDTALEIYDHIVLLKPEWAEVYHRRATLFFSISDYDSAMRDLTRALQYEPRHFAAMSGMGLIFQRLDNKKAALAAFRGALQLNPTMENLQEAVKRLEPDVDGTRL